MGLEEQADVYMEAERCRRHLRTLIQGPWWQSANPYWWVFVKSFREIDVSWALTVQLRGSYIVFYLTIETELDYLLGKGDLIKNLIIVIMAREETGRPGVHKRGIE